ncbi:killer cell lectin-like receptor subfamily B member 1B allele C [Manacus candei]|uniref:killer cell lectin-like receptor subfamily B member 1B allele C n=1 Tax=Manacus candei TaxID=415023 RepID=UPI00222642D4|nr:killer cell lectin-like receptor subfamily B member 1B allele C [Manacus candei]
MQDQDGYTALEQWRKRGAAGSPPSSPGAAVGSGFPEPRGVPTTAPPRRPRCLLGALTAALALSLVLCVSWWVAERAQPEASSGWGNTSLRPPCASLDGTFRELRRILCPPREAEGCRLCPVGWMLGRTKCYWVSERMNSWHRSREDCGDRGAAMAMPWDKDELDSLNETLRKPTRHFWIGLSVPAPGMGWTWVNGSRPDWSRFPQDLGEGRGACGALKGDRIDPRACDTGLQWVCQTESARI